MMDPKTPQPYLRYGFAQEPARHWIAKYRHASMRNQRKEKRSARRKYSNVL